MIFSKLSGAIVSHHQQSSVHQACAHAAKMAYIALLHVVVAVVRPVAMHSKPKYVKMKLSQKILVNRTLRMMIWNGCMRKRARQHSTNEAIAWYLLHSVN